MILSLIIARFVKIPKTRKRSRAAANSSASADTGDVANVLLLPFFGLGFVLAWDTIFFFFFEDIHRFIVCKQPAFFSRSHFDERWPCREEGETGWYGRVGKKARREICLVPFPFGQNVSPKNNPTDYFERKTDCQQSNRFHKTATFAFVL